MAPTRHFGVTPQVSSAEVASATKAGHGWLSAKAGKLLRVRYQKSVGREKGEMFTGGHQLFGKRGNRSLCGWLARTPILPPLQE